jgi:hypothetical protein
MALAGRFSPLLTILVILIKLYNFDEFYKKWLTFWNYWSILRTGTKADHHQSASPAHFHERTPMDRKADSSVGYEPLFSNLHQCLFRGFDHGPKP